MSKYGTMPITKNLMASWTFPAGQLSPKKFHCLCSPSTKVLPIMTVFTINFEQDGMPLRAKYQIFSLGNLETTDWPKSDVYAPVMSLLELHLLTALAVCNHCVIKSGDVKQAFVQALLPRMSNIFSNLLLDVLVLHQTNTGY